ncbi:MAG: extracellular solute-binding protein [Bacteroidales bacterium]|nr:extracellular solute-binding protein [Lachnoclostridium sp.]MCM1385367.1 extracellular solute-binding protein [Lachnoclostridium sp.]MCM1466195.1 extracellular solute-binding protein [Bacteroidales bacterium]
MKHRFMKTKIFLAACCLTAVSICLAGCSKAQPKQLQTVKLSVWWSDEGDRDLLNQAIEEFKKEYADEAVFEITISTESVLTSRDTILANPQAAADVYMFADDQFEVLRQENVLLEITENADEVIAANGGVDNGACKAAMHDGKLYGYPVTAGNGYFLYYNSAYLTEEDIKELDRILEVSAKNGKKTTIDYSSGWYIYSFFRGADLELGMNDDGVTNHCNWNATDTHYKGVDVAEAMLKIATNDGFVHCDDTGFLDGVKDGSIIAGINGAWNAETVKEAWGENFAAAKLPHYTVAGDSVQMCSFSGYKLLGINPYSENTYYAMKLAEYLSSEEMQIKRFEVVGECPSNVNAAASSVVQASPVIAALAEQSQYADTQRIANTFWNPAYIYGITIAGKNADNQDLQALLDIMVNGVTAQPTE